MDGRRTIALEENSADVVLGLVKDCGDVVLGLVEVESPGESVLRLDATIVASTNVKSLGPSHSNPALWQRLQMGRSKSYGGIRHCGEQIRWNVDRTDVPHFTRLRRHEEHPLDLPPTFTMLSL
jgi:hypothetical protein